MIPEVVLLCALTKEHVIGRHNQLLWKLRADMRRFKELTTGHAVIMGRKTWDSLGRPLPNRRNIVITHQRELSAVGADVVHSLEEALLLANNTPRIYVIGGGEIYTAALPAADRLLLTFVDAKLPGDAYFPEFSREEFEEVSREAFPSDEQNEHPYTFVEYRRRAKS